MAGYHQQYPLRLFRSDAPLHKRHSLLTRLYQWTIPTVLEMAAEQGLLAHPARFLTLWTAYGGQPHRWKRLMTERRYQPLLDANGWTDTKTWRRAFLDEGKRLK